MRNLVPIVLAGVGVLNLTPAIGVLGAGPLRRLYGIEVEDAALLLLLQHRAVLLGLTGLLLLVSIPRAHLRPAATFAALGSMLSFVVLAWPAADLSAPLARILWADVAGSIALIATLVSALASTLGVARRLRD